MTYYHSDQTCDRYKSRAFGGEVITCPHCNVSIAVTEGCDTIVCVCGDEFCYSIRYYELHGEYAPGYEDYYYDNEEVDP